MKLTAEPSILTTIGAENLASPNYLQEKAPALGTLTEKGPTDPPNVVGVRRGAARLETHLSAYFRLEAIRRLR